MHSGVEDNDKRETEHEANKAPLESYNDVPGMSFIRYCNENGLCT